MKIGIVILNYKSYADTEKLVTALQRQTIAHDTVIVVVDNASPNGSYLRLKHLETNYANVCVLQTQNNEGYARGNNWGLDYLEKQFSPRYVAIMNSDIALPIDCLEKLVERYEQIADACIVAPKQLLPDGRTCLGWNLPTMMQDVKSMSLLYRYYEKRKGSNVLSHTPVNLCIDVIPGSFLFASMSRFKEIGYFFPDTFLFVEERFVAYAAKLYGYKNYIFTDMSYLHEHSKSINTAFSLIGKYKMQYRGWLLYTKRCRKLGHVKALLMLPLMAISICEIACVGWLFRLIRK